MGAVPLIQKPPKRHPHRSYFDCSSDKPKPPIYGAPPPPLCSLQLANCSCTILRLNVAISQGLPASLRRALSAVRLLRVNVIYLDFICTKFLSIKTSSSIYKLEILIDTWNIMQWALRHIEPKKLMHLWAFVANNTLVVTRWNLY